MAWSPEYSREYQREYMRKWRRRHPERARANSRRAHAKEKHTGSAEDRRLRQTYGITLTLLTFIKIMHNNRCAACGDEASLLHLDHNHNTGEIRGMLCSGCNLGIGNFRDDPERLIRAANYLGEVAAW